MMAVVVNSSALVIRGNDLNMVGTIPTLSQESQSVSALFDWIQVDKDIFATRALFTISVNCARFV